MPLNNQEPNLKDNFFDIFKRACPFVEKKFSHLEKNFSLFSERFV